MMDQEVLSQKSGGIWFFGRLVLFLLLAFCGMAAVWPSTSHALGVDEIRAVHKLLDSALDVIEQVERGSKVLAGEMVVFDEEKHQKLKD
jgi:hypothetical protein